MSSKITAAAKSNGGALVSKRPDRRVVAYMPDDLYERLRKRCFDKDTTFSSAVRTAVETWLDEGGE